MVIKIPSVIEVITNKINQSKAKKQEELWQVHKEYVIDNLQKYVNEEGRIREEQEYYERFGGDNGWD